MQYFFLGPFGHNFYWSLAPKRTSPLFKFCLAKFSDRSLKIHQIPRPFAFMFCQVMLKNRRFRFGTVSWPPYLRGQGRGRGAGQGQGGGRGAGQGQRQRAPQHPLQIRDDSFHITVHLKKNGNIILAQAFRIWPHLFAVSVWISASLMVRLHELSVSLHYLHSILLTVCICICITCEVSSLYQVSFT